MKLNYQESSIVLVGGWNSSMLNPMWLEEFIVNPMNTNIELNIDKAGKQFEFRINFNFNVQNLNEIKQAISENPMNNLKELIEVFLTTAYNAKVVE